MERVRRAAALSALGYGREPSDEPAAAIRDAAPD